MYKSQNVKLNLPLSSVLSFFPNRLLCLLFAIICVEEIRNDDLASVSHIIGIVYDSAEVTYKGLINKLSLSSAGTTVSPGLAIFFNCKTEWHLHYGQQSRI